MTIKEAIQEYLAMRRGEGSPLASIDDYNARLRILLKFFTKKNIHNVSAVTSEHIDAYMAYLAARGLKFASRICYLSTTWTFFDRLHKAGKILTNPARDISIPKPEEEPLPEPPLEEQEVSRLIDSIPRRNVADLRNKLHLELLYSCGLRISESLNLKVSDFDLPTRSLRVKGKGGKVRVLPLMKGVLGAFKDYQCLRRSLLKSPDTGILLLGTGSGRKLSNLVFGMWLRGWCKKVGIKRRVHAHLFRHSIAVHLLQRGADIRYIQQFLGHSSLDTTKIYLRLITGRLKEDYDKAMPLIDLGTQEPPKPPEPPEPPKPKDPNQPEPLA